MLLKSNIVIDIYHSVLKGERREMKFKVIIGMMLILLLIGMLTLAFNIQQVKAEPCMQFEPTAPVGGIYISVNKLELLGPYITLVSTIILVVSILVAHIRYRKKRGEIL